MRKVYCGNIGVEYHHIQDREKRRWIRAKIEGADPDHAYGFGNEQKSGYSKNSTAAVVFERFLHTKYIGQKRFSLEGGENTIVSVGRYD